MAMPPNALELFTRNNSETNRNQSQKAPKPFERKKSRPLPRDLEEHSLSALNEMLNRQKEHTQMSAVSPLSSQFVNEQFGTEGCGIQGIEPSAQVSDLFVKLVDTLIFIDKGGIKETSLTLAGGIFAGAKITITEYSTAPKIFNIQFAATAETLSYFQGHAASLLAALQNGKFGFSVQRLDTSLLTKEQTPLVSKVKREEEKDDN